MPRASGFALFVAVFAAAASALAGDEGAASARSQARAIVKGYASSGGADEAARGAAIEAVRALGDPGLAALGSVAEKDSSPSVRLAAVEMLPAAYPEKASEILARVALEEPREEIRAAAADGLKRTAGKTPDPILAALDKGGSRTERACAAVDRIRDREGIGRLITVYVSKTQTLGGGGTHRGYLMVTKDQSYIKDVQPQVNGTNATDVAAVLDPEIGTTRSGTVLETQVKSVRILRDTIFRISGTAFGSVEEIRAWWDAHKSEF